MLKGKRILLDALTDKDLDTVLEWYNDISFLRYYNYDAALPRNIQQIRKMLKGDDINKYIPFAVREHEKNEIIGLVEVDNIDYPNRTCWISIGFGNKNVRGKGYGFEALSLLINYIFNELNLERVQLNVISYNDRAIKLYEKLGFKREGTYRKELRKDGERYDLYHYGLLLDEWKIDTLSK